MIELRIPRLGLTLLFATASGAATLSVLTVGKQAVFTAEKGRVRIGRDPRLRPVFDPRCGAHETRVQLASPDSETRRGAAMKLGHQADPRSAPVVEAALYLPALTGKAVEALALLGTPASQRSLVDFASHLTVPIESRRQAAQAFAQSVQRHGILLTESEILAQYDRYNASASLDADTQQVFGSLLDTIESLRAQADSRLVQPASFQP